jgi:hypothetical protein
MKSCTETELCLAINETLLVTRKASFAVSDNSIPVVVRAFPELISEVDQSVSGHQLDFPFFQSHLHLHLFILNIYLGWHY